eukprot:CAMPEP_0196780752 /NCGR_PEP_ID=MMETSP1104-20130614/8479_1 /TAXON_ID=33652 /ORGANISM="Cafeteria sp., Strain Caron Lab Isolate" /LENGTH=194 /DNA_ID=CAMNT_0042150967 /DNA_START=20 /DNA_END=607 /DNA_ORIENTATION=-
MARGSPSPRSLYFVAMLLICAAARVPAASDPCMEHSTCSECIDAESCGQCIYQAVVDGAVTQKQKCITGNVTAPADSGVSCVHWSMVSCSCVNGCNNKGRCDEDGICHCYDGWGAEDCSDETKPHGNPAVLIPIALICAAILVGSLVAAHVMSNSDRCWNRRKPRDPERARFRRNFEHPNQGEAANGLLGGDED